MSTVLQMQTFTSTPFSLREKNIDSFAPAFTSVNGRNERTPPSHDPKPTLSTGATTWSPSARRPEDDHRSTGDSASPTMSDGGSPDSPNKRRRSDPGEDGYARPSPDGPAGPAKHHVATYQPVALHQGGPPSKENAQQRTLPPLERADIERRWATEPRELPQSAYQEMQRHDNRPTEPFQKGGPSNPTHSLLNVLSEPNYDDEHAREMARAGVQVELKKRKRQFANRTKTGCGTCRRRKKKCDEMKPECNNCTRGSFVCEGYANKIPWPKNGVVKPPPPLQAKERTSGEPMSAYPTCPVCNQIHIPHCESPRTAQAQYSAEPQPQQSNGHDGARSHPIAVDDERKLPTSSSWAGNSWGESVPPPPPRTTYASEPHAYSQPPSIPSHERSITHEHPVLHHQQADAPRQQHNPRVYHQTSQSMSQGMISTLAPVVPAKTATHHHQVAQHARQPPPPPPPVIVTPTAAPPGPPPTLYTSHSRMHKSEKEKMLAGLPFLPHDRELVNERTHCAGAVYQFNSTANAAVSIAKDERARCFKTIVAARWIPPHTTEHPIVGHLGGNVHVVAPFSCDYGYNLSIAENVTIGTNCELHDSARIAIGMNTRIGNRVLITTIKLPTDIKALKGSNGTEIAQEVFIGKNVYIGDGCIIEAGVRIGDNTIVRAGSVVVQDLPRDCIAHGNPALG
ncbi:maltose O-acetyltransferas-like protein [Plenodomus tracheiphilus IPT5]|uniref:Maltose O-acetyltransferas-like protein n=1 Tax=Plenodomus tracheiphilus IPT5 TaxID=1408161 RepID=A0A6A7B0F3_9PLEO|nr:maltose O-acetyltransferas-like protein [Plenodomus tracheiphilus IPT5]